MTNVLVLCHGNINRSPACAAALKKWFSDRLSIESAGFVNPGRPAAKKMRDAMRLRGYNLDEHRSQLVTLDMVRKAKWVILMDGGNRRRFREQFSMHTRTFVCFMGLIALLQGCYTYHVVRPVSPPVGNPRTDPEEASSLQPTTSHGTKLSMLQMPWPFSG